ncbi:MAG: hypothetical protein CMH41_04635 [Micrococcales bacterium]|nr:hypothetical protein [Micrococcales bacterium]
MDPLVTALSFILGFGSLALVVWGFIDAYGFAAEDFRAVNRMPRLVWVAILLVGFFLLLLVGSRDVIANPLSLGGAIWVAVMIATGVYFYDQRPKLRLVRATRDP